MTSLNTTTARQPRLGHLATAVGHDLHRNRMRAMQATGLRRGELRLLRALSHGPTTVEALLERRDARDEHGGHPHRHHRGPRGFGRGFGRDFGKANRAAPHAFGRHAFGPHASPKHDDASHGIGLHCDTERRAARRSAWLQHRLQRFVTLGLAKETDAGYELSEHGTAVFAQIRSTLHEARATAYAGISVDDLATTIATLQAIRANLQAHAPQHDEHGADEQPAATDEATS